MRARCLFLSGAKWISQASAICLFAFHKLRRETFARSRLPLGLLAAAAKGALEARTRVDRPADRPELLVGSVARCGAQGIKPGSTGFL